MEKVLDTLLNDATVGFQQVYLETMEKRNDQFEDTQAKFNAFMNTLDNRQKSLFSSWRNAESKLQMEEMESAYKLGVKTGAMLIIEIYELQI